MNNVSYGFKWYKLYIFFALFSKSFLKAEQFLNLPSKTFSEEKIWDQVAWPNESQAETPGLRLSLTRRPAVNNQLGGQGKRQL